jgi:hypothetical protein
LVLLAVVSALVAGFILSQLVRDGERGGRSS